MSGRIEAAAIMFRGGAVSVPRPGRHPDVIKEIIRRFGLTEKDWPVIGEQGFITDDGHFVGRREAARIAHEAGQTTQRLARLFSEDVW